ncbi:MAG: hypothetical protein N3B68_01715, partial [Anaerolineae bacterium]|nr:hypothetical protein [Anaerolineae bacterium]
PSPPAAGEKGERISPPLARLRERGGVGGGVRFPPAAAGERERGGAGGGVRAKNGGLPGNVLSCHIGLCPG